MFQAAIIRLTVKLRVAEVAKDVAAVVEARARKLLEGICSYSGYVRAGTLRMVAMGPGVLSSIDMGRHYSFACSFAAEVCNPTPGTRITANVRSINSFGALVEAGYIDAHGSLVPVVELVVVRDVTVCRNEVDIDTLAVGDEVAVEVLGRRFEMRDSVITGFARTVAPPAASPDARGAAPAPGPPGGPEPPQAADGPANEDESAGVDGADDSAAEASDTSSSGGGYSSADTDDDDDFEWDHDEDDDPESSGPDDGAGPQDT